MIVKDARWSMDASGSWVSFLFSDSREALRAAQDIDAGKPYDLMISRHRERRSKNANSYFHVLINRIAAKVGDSDIAVKRRMVCDYGALERDENGELIGVKLPEKIEPTQLLEYPKFCKTTIENGKRFSCYLLYKPTHTLNTAEMARLIDGTVAEAKNLGIETMTPAELALLIEEWGKENDQTGNAV